MLILPNKNILLDYIVSMRQSFVLLPGCCPPSPGFSAVCQADGIEVSSLPLPLLDAQCLPAGLGTRLPELAHPGGMQPVTISVLTVPSADSVGCPSLLFQMIFLHMFEIFYRLDRKLYLVLALSCTGSPSERFILCLVIYILVSWMSRLCNIQGNKNVELSKSYSRKK